MPFAPKIRKNILQALESQIIPVLHSQTVPQILAAPPFDFSTVKSWPLYQELLPNNDERPLQDIREWPEHCLVASRGLFLMFLYEGVLHEKVGILAGHKEELDSQKVEIPPGIQVLKLNAPSSIIFTDFVAHSDGKDSPEKLTDNSRAIRIYFDKDKLTTSYSYRGKHQRETSHRLQLHDNSLMQLGKIYLEEMRQNGNCPLAQTLLLAIMYRLCDNLQRKKPGISNSCRSDELSVANDDVESAHLFTKTEMKHHAFCKNVIYYIQNNVHQNLSTDSIAAHFQISPSYLSKIFRKTHGVTIMRYVTTLRIDIAKRILEKQDEQICEVARLTGFASTTSFSHVFRKYTGFSPREFRLEVRKIA